MFENLTQRLNRTLKNISGKGRITEDNIKDTLREVRTALLEADVALPVVKTFTARVKERALGQEVALSLTPGQEFIKAVHAELVATMGGETSEINLAHQPPAVILLAGLQGAGKTTTAAKLALYLKERMNKKVMLTSVDTYRPAAMDQLKTLGKEINVDCYPSDPKDKPEDIAVAALKEAKLKAYDVMILDTAGRLAVDQEMMDEVKRLHGLTDPIETFFVVDAMTGQDAANTAKAFNDALALTGVILTKADGDARGGAALSVREITGKPIKFIGTGEKSEDLDAFHPDRIASRILGMGDVVSLVEKAQEAFDKDEAERIAKKMQKNTFDLQDYLDQLENMKKMGSADKILEMIPGAKGNISEEDLNLKEVEVEKAIIKSMTKFERENYRIIGPSRRKRIAKGSGTSVADVNRLLKKFEKSKLLMKKLMGNKKLQANMLNKLGM